MCRGKSTEKNESLAIDVFLLNKIMLALPSVFLKALDSSFDYVVFGRSASVVVGYVELVQYYKIPHDSSLFQTIPHLFRLFLDVLLASSRLQEYNTIRFVTIPRLFRLFLDVLLASQDTSGVSSWYYNTIRFLMIPHDSSRLLTIPNDIPHLLRLFLDVLLASSRLHETSGVSSWCDLLFRLLFWSKLLSCC